VNKSRDLIAMTKAKDEKPLKSGGCEIGGILFQVFFTAADRFYFFHCFSVVKAPW
jgi:hypothetical protein